MYCVDKVWIYEWRDFIEGKREERPTKINNKKLLDKIQDCRYKKSYPWDETDIGISEKDDLFIVSLTFWNFLVKYYGCDYTIE